MPLKIIHRNAEEVPSPGKSGKTNEDAQAIQSEMAKLQPGMVLEIETGSEKAVRGTKVLISRAAKQMDAHWQHWHVGSTVFARPVEEVKKRAGRAKKDA